MKLLCFYYNICCVTCGRVYIMIMPQSPFAHRKDFSEHVRSSGQTMGKEGGKNQDSQRHKERELFGYHAHAKQRRDQVYWREKLISLAHLMQAIH